MTDALLTIVGMLCILCAMHGSTGPYYVKRNLVSRRLLFMHLRLKTVVGKKAYGFERCISDIANTPMSWHSLRGSSQNDYSTSHDTHNVLNLTAILWKKTR
jgi:hypothetical protein